VDKSSVASVRLFIKKLSLLVAVVGLLGGCATSGNQKDPIEGFNRAMFAFNDGLDKGIIKPVAQGYEAVLPQPVRTGVANFFANIGDLFIAVNNLLQGKVPEAINDVGRVLVNSTLGVLGVMDVASDLGMEKHEEDFGQTLGRWGVGDGAYVVLPLFGPRTLRDTVGLVVDWKADMVADVDHIPTRNALLVTRVVSNRALMLPSDKIVEEAALDRYSFVRDGYLQRRRSLIFDGNPPRHDEDGASLDTFASAARAESAESAAAQPDSSISFQALEGRAQPASPSEFGRIDALAPPIMKLPVSTEPAANAFPSMEQAALAHVTVAAPVASR